MIFLVTSSFYFPAFSPLKAKWLEMPLSFTYSKKTEKLATFTRLREAIGVESTTPEDWQQNRKKSAILVWGWLQSWPSHCYKPRGRPGKGNSSHVTDPHPLPCHRALGHPCFPGTAHRDHQHSSGARSTPWISIPPVPKARPPLLLAWQWQKSPTFCLLWHVEWWQRLKKQVSSLYSALSGLLFCWNTPAAHQ